MTATEIEGVIGVSGGENPFEKYPVDLTRAEERLGTIGDIADVVIFVASEKSRWLIGQYVSASGGITGV